MLAIAGGVVVGLVYTLSPLTVLCALTLVVILRWGSRGLTPRERRWFLTLVIVAIVARVALVAGLFLTADSRLPYATFFGDEELFKNRSIWLRNLALGLLGFARPTSSMRTRRRAVPATSTCWRSSRRWSATRRTACTS